jgi:hypothetical protein
MMSLALDMTLEELNAADARSAALNYVSEAFAEAVLDGIEVDAFAEAAFCAAFRELVAIHGEERSIAIAQRLADRIRAGEFSIRTRQ